MSQMTLAEAEYIMKNLLDVIKQDGSGKIKVQVNGSNSTYFDNHKKTKEK